jgi:myosin heavy subunit
MDTIGIQQTEQEDIMTVACAVLHCSNIDFNAISADESEVNRDNRSVDAVLDLLGVTLEDFNRALCYFSIQAGKEKHTRSVSADKAQKGMGALIKATYGALFTYIVKSVNASITVKGDTSGKASRGGARGGAGSKSKIGVLDIFGFESFKKNSFEQLCINYCNEALQQQFNLFVLKNEQDEYEREGIQWSFIAFPENQDVLELIYKKGAGILNILDDQCRAPGTTDKTFATDMYKKCTGHARFQADFRQVGSRLFGVIHYAGPVEYDTEGFVEKNRDELPKEATELLQSSSRALVRKLADVIAAGPEAGASATATPTGRRAPPNRGGSGVGGGRGASSSSKTTVGGQFSQQLTELRRKIDMTSPHYVRCLKPNDLLVPEHFDPVIIADQLRCAGVIEAVRVSRVGYPQRYTHSTFLKRYRILALKDLKKAARSSRRSKPVEVLVMAIARQVQEVDPSLKPDDAEEKKDSSGADDVDLVKVGLQVGKTKVFLRAHSYEIIEQLRHVHMERAAVTVQSIGLMFIAKQDYKASRNAIVLIQCSVRAMVSSRMVHEKRINGAALRIQTRRRAQVSRRTYVYTLYASRWLQRIRRGNKARLLFMEMLQQSKALRIQTWYRQESLANVYGSQKRSAAVLQMAWRCAVARAALKDLKAQQRDLSAIGGERDALKEEVQNLKRELEKSKKAAKASVEREKAAIVAAEAAKGTMVDSSQLESLREEKEQVMVKLNDAEKHLAEESKRAQDEATEKARLAKELEQGQHDLEDLRETFAAAKADARNQETRMVELEDSVENLKTKVADMEVDKAELADNNDHLMKKCEMLEEEVAEMEVDKEELADKNDHLMKKCELLEEEVAEVTVQAVPPESNCVSTAEMDAKEDELHDLRDEIDRLQTALDERPSLEEVNNNHADNNNNNVASEEYDQVEKEKQDALAELEETKDLHAKELIESTERLEEALKHMEMLEGELETAQKELASANLNQSLSKSRRAVTATSTMPSMSGMGGTGSGGSNEEVEYLQSEILRLEKEVEEAKTQVPAAAPQATVEAFNPNSSEHLIARYEELRKLSEANIEKDREMDSLRQENKELTKQQLLLQQQQSNSKTGGQRRFLGDGDSQSQSDDDNSVFDDASSLGFSDTADQPKERAASKKYNESDPFATFSGRKQKNNRRSSHDTKGVRFEDYEALQAVNQMLRNEVDRLTKELSQTKSKAAEEKAQAEQDLEAFSEALKGVDEMRRAAEQMSRELTNHRRRKRFSRIGSQSNWETMSARDDVSVMSGATEMIDEAQKILHRSNRHANNTQNLFTRIRGGMGMGQSSGMGQVKEEHDYR